MTLRMKAKRTFAVDAIDGEDTVLFGITLPGKTVLNGFRVNASYVLGAAAAGAHQIKMTGSIPLAVETWLLPMTDPDTPSTYKLTWDRLVPKDVDNEVIDLDTTGLDTTNFWEPGEMNLNMALRLGAQPMRLSHFHKFTTAANSAVWTGQTIEPVPVQEALYTPGGGLSIRVKRSVFVNKPAYLVCAMTLPNMDDVVTSLEAPLSEAELGLVRYMRQSLEGAIMHQLGITGAGGGTWFDSASAALLRHLNPDVYEETAGIFVPLQEYMVVGEATIDHSVEGRVRIKSISGGRG